MNKITKQLIASTLMDSQGEKKTKEELEILLGSFPTKCPIGQHHDPSFGPIGYLYNFEIGPIENSPNEWAIYCDVEFSPNVKTEEIIGGFSYSVLKLLYGNAQSSEFEIYVPWPHYNDLSLLKGILNLNINLEVGKWIKKSAEPISLGLIVYKIAIPLIAGAIGSSVKKLFFPKLLELTKFIIDNSRGLEHFDLGIHVVHPVTREIIQIYFITKRNDIGSLSDSFLQPALDKVKDWLLKDDKGVSVGFYKVFVKFDEGSRGYIISRIQYKDGSVRSVD